MLCEVPSPAFSCSLARALGLRAVLAPTPGPLHFVLSGWLSEALGGTGWLCEHASHPALTFAVKVVTVAGALLFGLLIQPRSLVATSGRVFGPGQLMGLHKTRQGSRGWVSHS